MIITCENCESRFRFDESRIPTQGAQVRCSRCGSSFFVPFPEEEIVKEENPLDGLPAAEAVQDEEEDLLDRTLAEFNSDLSVSQSGIDPEIENHSVTKVERSELFAAELEALGTPEDGDEDGEKEEVAVDDLDLAFDMPEAGGEASNPSPPLSSSDSNLQQERREEDADDDESMVGLLEPLAHESLGEEEDFDGLGSPEEWDLIGDSRVDSSGGKPPRSEDLSGSSLGLEDLFIPDSTEADEEAQRIDEPLVGGGHEFAIASAPSATEIDFEEQTGSNAGRSTSRSIGLAKQVAGWTASLLLLCYAGYANFPKWSASLARSPVFHAVQLDGMALRDIEVRRIENLSGTELLVVSGELTRDPTHGSQALLAIAALKGPVEKSEAIFGLALPIQVLREGKPGEIQKMLEVSGQAFARQPRAGRAVPVQAVFESSLAARRELQISTRQSAPPLIDEEKAADVEENVNGQGVVDSSEATETATSIRKAESLPSSLLPSAPTE